MTFRQTQVGGDVNSAVLVRTWSAPSLTILVSAPLSPARWSEKALSSLFPEASSSSVCHQGPTLPLPSLGFLGKFYFFRVTKYLFILPSLPEWLCFFRLRTDSLQGLMLT